LPILARAEAFFGKIRKNKLKKNQGPDHIAGQLKEHAL